MHLVQLTGFESAPRTRFSGGQQQRVALARALVMEPKVLLMDEPLSNLDAKLREQMRTEIRRIQRELGITSVYVTHDQLEAMTLSDRVVVMNQGVIEQVGTPMDIYRYPRSRFVADFIGRANFVIGEVLGSEAMAPVVSAFGKARQALRKGGGLPTWNEGNLSHPAGDDPGGLGLQRVQWCSAAGSLPG
jgi:ABC-type Fe3+/spermidine/putrescine transport system ATPase subunit